MTTSGDWGYSTVLVQIFKGHTFRGCHKFSISRFYFRGSQDFILLDYMRTIIKYKFQGLNFCGPHVIHKNSEIYVPRKFVRVQVI